MSLETAFVAIACILVTLSVGVLLIIHVIRKIERDQKHKDNPNK